MSLYRNAFYWFIAVLGLLVVGFWQSYFSRLGDGELGFFHHFHSIVMLGWVLLLITQSWLIRNRENTRHRAVGKVSFLIAPLVVISGIMVTFYSNGTFPDPSAIVAMEFLWVGLASVLVFGILYFLAIKNRRTAQLHARYMCSTALVFIVPGLSRATENYMGEWAPEFFLTLWTPLLIGMWLMISDIRKGRTFQPWLVFNILWGVVLAQWVILPKTGFWQDFAVWAAENLGQ